jgi:hypothetical protein
MRQTTAEAGIIEHIAQEQLKFEIVFEEQTREQTKPAVTQPNTANIGNPPKILLTSISRTVKISVVQCHRILMSWVFPKASELLSNLRSRVKILHAAHAALMCLVTCKFISKTWDDWTVLSSTVGACELK